MKNEVRISLIAERMAAWLASFFGVLALTLASVGIYGIVLYHVTRRTTEIGVRMALGAVRQQIVWLVLRNSLSLVAIGALIGAPLIYFTGRALSGFLYNVGAHDPLMLGASLATLVTAAAIASVVPARRASRVDPMLALRAD